MALNEREKKLATVTGVLAAAAGAWFAFTALSGPLTTLRIDRDNLQSDVDQKERQVQAAWKAEKQMAEFRGRSLPSNAEIARSLYKNWLLALAREAGLKDTRVEPNEIRASREVYRVLPFSIHASGTLDELTEFLFGFYSKDYLHKIRQLTIKPEGSELDLIITIEALSLPEADHEDSLSEAESPRLAGASLSDFDLIAERNLFAPYRPPPPPVVERPREPEPPRGPPPPPAFDPSKYTFVTGIVEENGQPQLWLKARTTGETFKLAVGDTFDLGPVRGKVLEIHQRAAEIELDGERRLIPLGKSLQKPDELPN